MHEPRLLMCLAILSATGFSAANDCDRACLKSTLDQYLIAVTKHDPAAAPLSPGFRQTENSVVVRSPNGMWKTATALGKIQRRYADPVTGQVGYFGVVIEDSPASAIVTVRLIVEQRKITE